MPIGIEKKYALLDTDFLYTSYDTFNANFYKQYYGSFNEMENLNDVEAFLAALKECDDNVPHKMGLGEKKTYAGILRSSSCIFEKLDGI